MYPYCEKASSLPLNDLDRIYHDTVYGFPTSSDDKLFERLVMEIQQAGLSWTTILRKQAGLKEVFAEFSLQAVASFSDQKIKRILKDPRTIRNRRKTYAIRENAKRISILQDTFGSFKQWLDLHHQATPEEWVRLFSNTFTFTGPIITKEFLMSTNYLPGAHSPDCPIAINLQTSKWG